MLRIPNWRLALPLTLRRKDRLELFFEARGHGQAFDDHVVEGDRVYGHSHFVGFGDELCGEFMPNALLSRGLLFSEGRRRSQRSCEPEDCL